ncbi:MAG: RidA family protein [Oceanicaulis sp.]
MQALLPEGWTRPSGYSNGIAAEGRLVFVAGQIGWTPDGRFPATFLEQIDLALANTVAVLRAGGAEPEHVVRMTWYLTDLPAYRNSLKALGPIWKTHMGKVFPAMAAVGVTGLVEEAAMIEIETTAVIA